jgi:micrococcal nuclease
MSRRRRFIILVLCLLGVLLLARFDQIHHTHKSHTQPKTDEQTKTYDFAKYHTRTFTVKTIIDGDTIDIDIPDEEHKSTRIRLWGIDTPETKSPKRGVMYFGPQAAEFTRNLTLGKRVDVYLQEHRTRGKYGRLLAYVKLPNGQFLNEALLREGFAYADLRFRHSFYNKYKQLEAAARSNKKGLWKEVKREQLPQWLQKRKPNLLKK